MYVDQGICTGGYRVEVAKEVENPVDLGKRRGLVALACQREE
jgi:hypothetical protein